MSTKLTDLENTDEQYNPSSETGKDVYRNKQYSNDGIAKLENHANDPKNSTDPDRNIRNVNELEQGYYKQGTSQAGVGKKTSLTAAVGLGNIKLLRKRGPMALIAAVLLGGGGLIGFILAPASLPVALIETLTNDLDDSAGWANNKVVKLYGKKLGSLQSKAGFCGKTVTVRCKFSTMSSYQAKQFTKAGVELEGTRKFGGRIAVTGMTFTDPITGRKDTARDPAKLRQLLRDQNHVRSSLYRAFNPFTAKYLGNRFTEFLAGNGLAKTKKIKGETEGDARSSYTQANTDGSDDANIRTAAGNNDEASDGQSEEERDRINEQNGANNQLSDEINESIEENKGRLKIGNSATSLVRGVCAVKTLGSIIDYASKTQKFLRLAKFASIFASGASALKAGKMNAAEVKVMTETLVPSSYPDKVMDASGEMVNNPYKGKNVFDSDALRMVVHGDTKGLNSVAQKFRVGGGFGGKIGGMLDAIKRRPALDSAVTNSCKVANSSVAWIAELAIGATGIGAVIKTVLVGAAASAASNLLLQDALTAALEKAVDWAAGKDVTNDIVGAEAGDAIFAGMSYINGGMAQRLGMVPGTSSEIMGNMVAVNQEYEKLASVERYKARGTPMDVNNRYSFLGSIVHQLRGTAVTPTAKIQNLLSVTAAAINPFSLGQTASAASTFSMPVADYSKERFEQCPDVGYETIGMDADMFCNPRFVPFEEREIDPVITYMLNGNFIEEDGEPAEDTQYAKWITGCAERNWGWGEVNPDDDSGYGNGQKCREKTEQNINFSNYYAYHGSDRDMDEEPVQPQAALTDGGGSEFTAATLNVWGANHNANYKPRMDRSIKSLEGVDVAGMQEFNENQHQYFAQKTNWESYPKPSVGNRDSIVWNPEKFSFVEGGIMPNLGYIGANSKLNAPWVILSDNETQQLVYVLNTHDPARTPNSIKRYRNALQHVEFIKSIQSRGIPIVFTGDFNSRPESIPSGGNRTWQNKHENTAYCIIGSSGLLKNAYDVVNNVSYRCPNPQSNRSIDHIYISPTIQASGYKKIPKGVNGSDVHATHIVDLTIPGTGGGSTFNLSSFNICYGVAAGGGSALPACARGVSYKPRLARTISTIKENNLEVVGLQEVREGQWRDIQQSTSMSDYDIFPKTYRGYGAQNPIIWDSTRFDLVRGKMIAGYTVTGGKRPDANVEVLLRDKTTNQRFYLINHHDSVGRDDGAALKRYQSAQDRMRYIRSIDEDVPVFITGDFNSKFAAAGVGQDAYQKKKQFLPYCVYTSGGKLQHAADASRGKKGACPSFGDRGSGVDHIYMSPTAKAKGWRSFGRGVTNNGSDHPTVMASITIADTSLSSDYGTPTYKKNPRVRVDEPGSVCTGGFTVGAQSLSKDIKKRWPIIKSIGGYACRANTADPSSLSVHAVGRALDIMVNAGTPQGLKAGNEIRNYLIRNSTALGVQRVIWNRHIWSADQDGWRPYSGPSPHTDHVHAEINLNASRKANLAGGGQ